MLACLMPGHGLKTTSSGILRGLARLAIAVFMAGALASALYAGAVVVLMRLGLLHRPPFSHVNALVAASVVALIIVVRGRAVLLRLPGDRRA